MDERRLTKQNYMGSENKRVGRGRPTRTFGLGMFWKKVRLDLTWCSKLTSMYEEIVDEAKEIRQDCSIWNRLVSVYPCGKELLCPFICLGFTVGILLKNKFDENYYYVTFTFPVAVILYIQYLRF